MSNPIIPRTNSAPGAGAPASLYLGEVATNRSQGEVYLGTDDGVALVGEKVTSIIRGGTGSTSAAGALSALGAAPLVSPAFTGTPTVPTASVGTNTTQAASTAFVQANRGDKYLTTSTSEWTLANDTATFTVDAGLSYTPTQDVTVVYDAANHAHGTVVSYSGTTLVVDFAQHSGSGTYSQWTINVGGLSAQEGALLQANNLSDVASAAQALANIGGFSNTATLDILHGGSGATTQQGALNAFAGAVTANRALAGDGTNVTLRQLTTADVPSLSQLGGFSTGQILGLSSGGTGVSTTNQFLSANPFAPSQFINVAGRSSATIAGTVVNDVFTASANGAMTNGDGYAFQTGDLILNIGSLAGSSSLHLGPWYVTQLGSATTPIILTRPTWFRGTIPCGVFFFPVLNGTTIQGAVQIIRVSTLGVSPNVVVGTTPLSNLGSIINQSGASFSGTVAFRQNTSTQSAARFQAVSALMTAPVPHSMEWDNQRMYLTNLSSQRLSVAYTSDIPALTTAAAAALTTTALAGISTQAARADHSHAIPIPAINSTALTAYTLALGDANNTVSTSSGSAVTLTIPTNATAPFLVGSQILVLQSGAGQISVAPAAGVTLQSSGTKRKSAAQYSLLTLLKVATDTWVLGGDITA